MDSNKPNGKDSYVKKRKLPTISSSIFFLKVRDLDVIPLLFNRE